MGQDESIDHQNLQTPNHSFFDFHVRIVNKSVQNLRNS
jgi:hypothetical protein